MSKKSMGMTNPSKKRKRTKKKTKKAKRNFFSKSSPFQNPLAFQNWSLYFWKKIKKKKTKRAHTFFPFQTNKSGWENTQRDLITQYMFIILNRQVCICSCYILSTVISQKDRCLWVPSSCPNLFRFRLHRSGSRYSWQKNDWFVTYVPLSFTHRILW